MMKVLFVCSQNRLRSPTAEQVFSTWPGIDVSSAGLNHDAENPVTPELVEWADIHHRSISGFMLNLLGALTAYT